MYSSICSVFDSKATPAYHAAVSIAATAGADFVEDNQFLPRQKKTGQNPASGGYIWHTSGSGRR